MFLFSIAARAKKVIETSVTPQQGSPEHRAASRRAGVSQSQRKLIIYKKKNLD